MRAPSLRELQRIAERFDEARILSGFELKNPLAPDVNYFVGGTYVKLPEMIRALVERQIALVLAVGLEEDDGSLTGEAGELAHLRSALDEARKLLDERTRQLRNAKKRLGESSMRRRCFREAKAVLDATEEWYAEIGRFSDGERRFANGLLDRLRIDLGTAIEGRPPVPERTIASGGLTAEQCAQAAENFGIDLACGACASQFYTGYGGYDHDEGCKSVLRGIVTKQSIRLEILPPLEEADLVPRSVSATDDAYDRPVMIGAPIVACSHPAWFWDWDEDRAMSPPKRRCTACRAEAPPAVREIQVGDRLRWEPSDGSTMVVESVLDGLPFVGLCFDCRSAVTHHVPLFHQDATARWNRVLVHEDGSAAKYPEKKE